MIHTARKLYALLDEHERQTLAVVVCLMIVLNGPMRAVGHYMAARFTQIRSLTLPTRMTWQWLRRPCIVPIAPQIGFRPDDPV